MIKTLILMIIIMIIMMVVVMTVIIIRLLPDSGQCVSHLPQTSGFLCRTTTCSGVCGVCGKYDRFAALLHYAGMMAVGIFSP